MRFDPAAKPGVSNLLQILGRDHRPARSPTLEAEYAARATARLKTAVADAVVEFLRPLQERYAELAADPAEVDAQLAAGADKAEAIATKVLERVRRAAGLLPRGR